MSGKPVLIGLVSDGVVGVMPYDKTFGGQPAAFWYGAYPYLDTGDGATSYGDLNQLATTAYMGFQLDPFTPTPTLEVQFQIQFAFVGINQPTFRLMDAPLVDAFSGGSGLLAQVLHPGVEQPSAGSWVSGTIEFSVTPEIRDAAQRGDLVIVRNTFNPGPISQLYVATTPVLGRLAIDTHDHPFHVVGTRDPAMPYELVIDTGTQRLVEIVSGEESLATHELVIDETGRAGDPWTHCGLFRPL